MTHPHEAAAAIRAAIKPSGTWFIADINGGADFEENLSRPLSPLFYAISVMSCMSSALSTDGGAGYGTLGLPEPEMRKLVERAGFTRFGRLELTHPVNAFYEGLRCATAEVKTYARHNATAWEPVNNPEWKPLDSLNTTYSRELAKQGVCRGRAPRDSVTEIVYKLRTPFDPSLPR